jgi:hypothetical protein
MGSRIIKHVSGRDRTPPPTPTALAGVASALGEVRLSCSVSADPQVPGEASTGTTGYRWYVSTDGQAFSLIAQTTTPAYAHTGLAASTVYHYRVSAVDFTGNESALSASIAVTTQAAEGVNDPPAWTTRAINIGAYPGQAVSYTFRWGSTPDGNDAWDINGDNLVFSEQATGVLSLIGLSCSSTGVISGTVPAAASPQALTATIGVTDGEFTATKQIGVTVYAASTGVDADYLIRASAPGVFFATDWTERRVGCPGYLSADGLQTGQQHDPTYYLTNKVTTSGRDRDAGDGLGTNWRETSPEITSAVGGAAYGIRRLYRINPRSSEGAIIAPWSKMPRDYVGVDAAAGFPGFRRGEKGTAGEGARFRYVETERDTSLPSPSNNPTNAPCARHFYLQFQIRLSRDLLWYKERWVRGKHLAGSTPTQSNKLVFVTNGQTSDQVAVINGGTIGRLRPYFQNGNATPWWQLTRVHKGRDERFFCPAIDNAASGEPAAASTTPYDSMLRRYGPAWGDNQMNRPAQASWAATIADPELPLWRDTHVLPPEAEAYGLDPFDANLLSAPWRRYPYGGFSEAVKKYMPDLNIPAETWTGFLEPDRWHVVEILVSDQYDAPVNDSALRPAQKTPCSPRFVALWAAPLGEPLRLLGYTNQGNDVGPAADPSRINDNKPVLFKWQESDFDNICYSGWMVIGPSYHPAAMAPTDTQFDVILYNDISRSGLRQTGVYSTNNNRTSEWAAVDGWGDDSTLGFCRGELSKPQYEPSLPNTDDATLGQWQQAEILSSRLINATATAPDLAERQIHRITLRAPLPVVPVASTGPSDIQDGVIAHHVNDRKSQDKRLYYGPIIFSCDPIPAPGHLDKALPTPWRD